MFAFVCHTAPVQAHASAYVEARSCALEWASAMNAIRGSIVAPALSFRLAPVADGMRQHWWHHRSRWLPISLTWFSPRAGVEFGAVLFRLPGPVSPSGDKPVSQALAHDLRRAYSLVVAGCVAPIVVPCWFARALPLRPCLSILFQRGPPCSMRWPATRLCCWPVLALGVCLSVCVATCCTFVQRLSVLRGHLQTCRAGGERVLEVNQGCAPHHVDM